MSSSELTTISPRRYRPRPRPDIIVEGKVWKPRAKLADKFGFTDRAAQRRNWRTAYIAGVAYCEEESAAADLVSEASRRNEPLKRKRG
jgi:hypothetical protein